MACVHPSRTGHPAAEAALKIGAVLWHTGDAMPEAPEQVELIGDEVAIRWPDGREDYLPSSVLRAASPSAENKGERDILGKVHGGSFGKDYSNVQVLSWTQVGNYALRFNFSDGHRTGIYSFDYLKKLSEEYAAGDGSTSS